MIPRREDSRKKGRGVRERIFLPLWLREKKKKLFYVLRELFCSFAFKEGKDEKSSKKFLEKMRTKEIKIALVYCIL